MKRFIFLLALGLSVAFTSCFSASPVLRYEFNQPGSTQMSTGTSLLGLTLYNYNNTPTDYISSAPVHRSGASNSNALNFTSANVDAGLDAANLYKGAAQATLNNTNAPFLRSELGSFTITAWVLNVTAQDGPSASTARRLFAVRNGASQSIIDFQMVNALGAANNTLSLTLTGDKGPLTFSATTVTFPTNNSAWYLVAVSYDATTGEVQFYAGEDGGSLLKMANFSNTTADGINNLLTNGTSLGIGNVGYNHQRRLNGYISDVAFYDTVLSPEDIRNLQIPEGHTAVLLGIGAALLFISLRSKSKPTMVSL